MGSYTSLFSLFSYFYFSREQTGMHAKARFQLDLLNDFKPTKLFVFGDSYVDTGNTGAIEPYGITYPGYPDGRWSDGIILTTLLGYHNQKLTKSVAELNTGEKDSVLILDLHGSFKSVINNSSKYNIENPLTPCCVGVSGEYVCGKLDEKGEKKYKVCDEPKSAFYWDVVHPTQAGWKAVYSELQRNGALQVFKGTNGHTSY
ncbi:hypothetical protein OROHE_008035 [Orobanche hederae]